MLSFSLVAEALTGLIYHRPSGENSKFLPSFLMRREDSDVDTLPDDGRSISRNVTEKHYDSRHDKLRNNMDTTESTNTNIFKMQYRILFLFRGLFICVTDFMNSKSKNVTFSSLKANIGSESKSPPKMTFNIDFRMAQNHFDFSIA